MRKSEVKETFNEDVGVKFFEYEGKEGYISKNYDEVKKVSYFVLFFNGHDVREYEMDKITTNPFIDGKSLEDVAEKLENIEG